MRREIRHTRDFATSHTATIADDDDDDDMASEEGALIRGSNMDGQGFNAQWQFSDTTHLAPTSLPLARVRRAWERKAISPLSRVGRNLADQVVGGGGEDDVLVGVNGKRGRGAGSPLKPVKKVKLDCDGGVGSGLGSGWRVSRWEERASPVRRIVTRSSAGLTDIVALAEEGKEVGEEEEEGDVTVEVFDEDGQLVEGVEEDEQSWSDVEVEDAVFEHTMTHLPDAMSHDVDTSTGRSSEGNEVVEKVAEDEEEIAAATTISHPAHEAPILSAPSELILPEGFVSPAKQRRKLGPRSSKTVSAARRQTLPVQFAPPVIATAIHDSTPVEVEAVQMEEPREQVGKLEAERLDLHAEEQEGAAQAHGEATESEMVQEVEVDDVVPVEDNEVAAATNDEWEDIEDEDDEEPQSEGQDIHIEQDDMIPTQAEMFSPQEDKLQSRPAASIEGPYPRLPLRCTPRRKSSSPLKQSTVSDHAEKPHLVAFTPLKRVQDVPHSDHLSKSPHQAPETHSQETSPTKLLAHASQAPPEEEPVQMSPRKTTTTKPPRISDDTALLQAFLHRAAAEKNKSSQRRRLSASEKESLTNRRDSDTVRQALAGPGKGLVETVLGELDVNTSLSPRKTEKGEKSEKGGEGKGEEGMDWQVEEGDQVPDDLARSQDAVKEADRVDPTAEPTPGSDGPDPEPEPGPATRRTRSGRERKKPQVYSQHSTPTTDPATSGSASLLGPSNDLPANGPSRITIRGTVNTNDFHVKRSEAQELAVLTRSNTRKNKGGSVMPRGRIGGLNKEFEVGKEVEVEGQGEQREGSGLCEGTGEVDAGAGDGGRKKNGKKNLTWAETLVSFYQGGTADTETSQLSDEPEEKMPWERGADFDPTIETEVDEPSKKRVKVAKAVPAAETPSKPKAKKESGKMRKLQRGGRTAASSSSSATATATAPAPAAAAPEKDMVAIRQTDVEMAIPAAAAERDETKSEVEEKTKPVSKARRSRIATPAKGRGLTGSVSNPALLPSDLNLTLAPTTISVSGTTTTTTDKKAPGAATAAVVVSKKRGGVSASRLPAPGNISAQPAPPTSAPALGLISSPAKKPRSAASAAAASAVAGAINPISFPPSSSTKAFAPKLDFAAAETLKPTFAFSSTEHEMETSAAMGVVPGLMSPAKKPRGRPTASGLGAVGKTSLAREESDSAAGLGSSLGSGLGLGLRASPAKRSRRRVG
ncbi:hypothetical protein LTR86_009815 [Recurvomyces mirabilis]|nr:hypothetical protein LTR86_009815 [Recurvomyces mirabilis]